MVSSTDFPLLEYCSVIFYSSILESIELSTPLEHLIGSFRLTDTALLVNCRGKWKVKWLLREQVRNTPLKELLFLELLIVYCVRQPIGITPDQTVPLQFSMVPGHVVETDWWPAVRTGRGAPSGVTAPLFHPAWQARETAHVQPNSQLDVEK